MTTTVRKIVRIGNSRGLRLPRNLIRKYGLYERVIIEERPSGIIIKRADKDNHLSYEETFKEMTHEEKSFHEWDITLDDGLKNL